MTKAQLLVVTLILVLVPVGTAAAAKRPDLRATAVGAPSTAYPGGPMPVTLQAVAGPVAVTRATGVRAYLSADRKRSRDDVALTGTAWMPPVKAKRKGSTQLSARLPATQGPGKRFVIACADDPGRVKERREANNCVAARVATTIPALPASGTDAQTLIADDLAAGRITSEQALAYRVLALFAAPELPTQYAAPATPAEDDTAVREVASRWQTLSLQTRRTLAPYLVRPAAEAPKAPPAPKAKKKAKRRIKPRQAAEDPYTVNGYPCATEGLRAGQWKSIPAAGGKVRINWQVSRPQDATEAPALADLVTTAYARYVQIMGREPISDGSSPCWHGEDGALDIYMVRHLGGADGLTMPSELTTWTSPDCEGMASFIQIDESSSTFTKSFTLAHELFHAFQNAFPYQAGCAEYDWMDEGSANWAAHVVLPDDNSEHFFEWTLTDPDSGLEYREYHTWVFDLWMEKTFSESSIRKAYEGFADMKSFPAVDKAIGGFRKHYLDFAKHGWNQGPLTPSFDAWDHFAVIPQNNDAPIQRLHLFLAGQHERTANVPVNLTTLGRSYHPFDITDEQVKEVSFRNPLADKADARIGAILTFKSGAVRFDDWSQKKSVTFCRDEPGQDVASIIVVYANSAYEDYQMTGNPELRLRDKCDGLPWHFKVLGASLKTHADGLKSGSAMTFCGTAAGLPLHGQTDFTVGAGAQSFSTDEDVKEGYGGKLEGEIAALGPAAFTYTLTGCDGVEDGGPIKQCSTVLSRAAATDWTIGFGVEAASKDAQNATLTWFIDNPSVGFVDFQDSVCNVQEFWHPLDQAAQQQEIPMSQLSGTEPVTLNFSGHAGWDKDSLGEAATITYHWDYSVTIQRVDEAGNPL